MLNFNSFNIQSILCLGAHEDDIEIGCGGTILKILAQKSSIDVHWVVLSSSKDRADEARRSAGVFLEKAGNRHIVLKDFRDTFIPYANPEIKEYFIELGSRVSPDIIFTHRLEDRHQDHRHIAELTWSTFRHHLIFEYEIPKYEGDLGHPNVFMTLSRETCEQKVRTIMSTFKSQKSKPWFSSDTFWALLRLRGVETNSSSHFAEGLYCRKLIF